MSDDDDDDDDDALIRVSIFMMPLSHVHELELVPSLLLGVIVNADAEIYSSSCENNKYFAAIMHIDIRSPRPQLLLDDVIFVLLVNEN